MPPVEQSNPNTSKTQFTALVKKVQSNIPVKITDNKPSKNKRSTGISLKTSTDTSYKLKKETNVLHKNKYEGCKECFRLQRYCEDCYMKIILKKHVTGKTSQQEFTNFIVKCLNESTSEHQALLGGAFSDITRSLGLGENFLNMPNNQMLDNENCTKIHKIVAHDNVAKQMCEMNSIFCHDGDKFTPLVDKFENNEVYFDCQKLSNLEENDSLKLPTSFPVDFIKGDHKCTCSNMNSICNIPDNEFHKLTPISPSEFFKKSKFDLSCTVI